jgi:hypothetical protein
MHCGAALLADSPISTPALGFLPANGYLHIGSYFLAATAFLMRLFIWRPNGREQIASLRTISFSVLWAVGGYVLGSGIVALARLLT